MMIRSGRSISEARAVTGFESEKARRVREASLVNSAATATAGSVSSDFAGCDASAARQAWKRELGAEYTFASDFWSHGAAAKQYGVFNEDNGAPIRGTFLIDKDGIVIWSLVKDTNTQRTEMVPESLDTLRTKA